jgi:transketolase
MAKRILNGPSAIKEVSAKDSLVATLRNKAKWVRREVLEMCLAAGAGHIAPAYSCADIIVALYQGGILRVNPKNPKWPERDRFILSKGQGCASLYAVLADMGFLPVGELRTYCQLGTYLGGHSESNVPGVEAFTGSLGQGFSIGAGMALAAKMDGKSYLTFVLLGDGELQEGSVWEAAMFAGHHHLNNLIAIVDRNKLQAINFTEDAMKLEPLAFKWEAFGWDVKIVDGHSFEDMLPLFRGLRARNSDKPLAVIAKTIKGKGVSFMENKIIWHFRIPTGEEIAQARKELSI